LLCDVITRDLADGVLYVTGCDSFYAREKFLFDISETRSIDSSWVLWRKLAGYARA